MSNPTKLLVLGAPRSGTSLLASMVGCHPDVGMLHENLGFAIRDIVAKRVVGNKLCVPNQIGLERRRGKWVNLLSPHFFHYLHKLGYFDRRPEGRFSIEDYMELHPLKVIGIVRDGDQAVSSMMRRGGISQELGVYRWSRSIEILSYLKNDLGPRFHLVLFEGLVGKPQSTMQRISSFLDLPYHCDMLEGYAHTPNYDADKIDATKSRKGTPDGINISETAPDVYRRYERLCSTTSKGLNRIST